MFLVSVRVRVRVRVTDIGLPACFPARLAVREKFLFCKGSVPLCNTYGSSLAQAARDDSLGP